MTKYIFLINHNITTTKCLLRRSWKENVGKVETELKDLLFSSYRSTLDSVYN